MANWEEEEAPVALEFKLWAFVLALMADEAKRIGHKFVVARKFGRAIDDHIRA